jgi:hypothetical protein
VAPHPSDPLILLCTTSYDEVTCFMNMLLSDFSYAGKAFHHVGLDREDVYPNIVAKYRQNQEKVVLIFCGHGEDHALMTGIKQDCEALDDNWDEDVFYDANHFDAGPEVLAAFCNSAGRDLGPLFAQVAGGNFLGFSDEICLTYTSNEKCISWWKTILHGFIIRVIDDETVDQQTLDFVRSLCQQAYSYFCSEKGKKIEGALGMRMCLRRNMLALCKY